MTEHAFREREVAARTHSMSPTRLHAFRDSVKTDEYVQQVFRAAVLYTGGLMNASEESAHLFR